MKSTLFRLTALLLVPFQVAVSVFFLLRGHNLPGGGFIGGLVAALAFVLARLADAGPETCQRIGRSATPLIVIGWLLMLLSVVPGMMTDGAAMVAWWGAEFSLPAIGKVKLGTVLVFDIGVYLTVVGAVVKISDVATGRNEI